MKVWLPYIVAGSGTDTFTQTLARGLEKKGIDVVINAYPHFLQYIPWVLQLIPKPKGINIILTNTWNGFAFKRKNAKLIGVEHLFILDPLLEPYKSVAQSIFHSTFIKYFEKLTQKKADKIISVSQATANAYHDCLGGQIPSVILNGIDTDFFTPADHLTQHREKEGVFRLLFVGNFSQRKGADLLPIIMKRLGNRYELYYTCGLRSKDTSNIPSNMTPLGSLNKKEIREQYRQADLMVFPTRLEGLPLSVMEAMACGTPVISNNTSSLPEVINNGHNGKLCPINNVDCYIKFIREMRANSEHLKVLRINATKDANNFFSTDRMVDDYLKLFESLIN